MKGHFDDTTLILFKKGDARAFKKIFNQFYAPLRYFAEKLTGDRTEAEDIVIETFTKLFQRHQYFETYTNIRAFLYITARNASFNMLQAAKRQAIRKKTYLTTVDMEEDAEKAQIMGELLNIIHVAIDELPSQCREIFKMIFYKGMSNSEIAHTLKIAENTVRSQKRRAIQLLRIVLREKHLAVLLLLYSTIFQCSHLHGIAVTSI